MITKKPLSNMGTNNIGWIKSTYHYSYDKYSNPAYDKFGVLKVLNDDTILPRSGYHNHPHSQTEVLCYVVEGELTHGDSLGNKSTLNKGDLQYISAGDGITCEEHNSGNAPLRVIQLWIEPSKKLEAPNYSNYSFKPEESKNQWVYMVSNKNGLAPVKVNQDINIYSAIVETGRDLEFKVRRNRQGYLLQVVGKSFVNSVNEDNHRVLLEHNDALEIFEDEIKIKPVETSHYLLLEMNQPQQQMNSLAATYI